MQTDWLALLTLSIALSGTVACFIALLGLIRRKEHDRDQRQAVEKLEFRETQLKYEYAVDSKGKKVAMELAWASLESLDDLLSDESAQLTAQSRERLRLLRRRQRELIDALVSPQDLVEDGESLYRFDGLLKERRSQLDALSPEEGRTSNG